MLFEISDPAVPLRTLTIADSARLGASIKAVGNRVAKTAGHALAIVLVVDEDGTPHLDLLGRNPMRLNVHDLARYTRAAVTAIGRAGREEVTGDEAIKAEWIRLAEVDERLAEMKRVKSAAVPWKCEHCGKGYKTERGAVAHERTCLDQPRDAEHRWAGGHNTTAGWIDTCRCGWPSPPGTCRQAQAALRAHFNEHHPVKDTDPAKLFEATDAPESAS